MTLETIKFHSLITMTGDTKTVIARNHAVVLGAGMAFDAIFETDLFIAYALVNDFIALMRKQMHMILTHPLRFFYALATFADVDFGNSRTFRCIRWNAQTQHGKDG